MVINAYGAVGGIRIGKENRDRAVGIAAGYGLDD
jgi:hypothetical protein